MEVKTLRIREIGENDKFISWQRRKAEDVDRRGQAGHAEVDEQDGVERMGDLIKEISYYIYFI